MTSRILCRMTSSTYVANFRDRTLGYGPDVDHGGRRAAGEDRQHIFQLHRDATGGVLMVVGWGAHDVQEDGAAGSGDYRRVVVADDAEHVVEMVVAPHLLGIRLVGEMHEAVVGNVRRIVAPAVRWSG